MGLPWQLSGKEPSCLYRRHRFNPWVWKIPRGRKWQPTPVFLTGKSHGQRSLEGYSPWGRKRVGYNLATKQRGKNMQVQMSKRGAMTGINTNSFKLILFKKRIIHKPLYRMATITGCEMPLTTDGPPQFVNISWVENRCIHYHFLPEVLPWGYRIIAA